MGRYISYFEIFACLIYRECVGSPPDLIKLPDTGILKDDGLNNVTFLRKDLKFGSHYRCLF